MIDLINWNLLKYIWSIQTKLYYFILLIPCAGIIKGPTIVHINTKISSDTKKRQGTRANNKMI